MNKLKKNTFTEEFKYDIVKKIKPLERKTIEDEWLKISNMYNNNIEFKNNARIGLKIIDYFTFKERLETIGKYNINFYDFVYNIEEFEKKKFIQNMLIFKRKKYENSSKYSNEINIYKEVYNITIGAINAFRPTIIIDYIKKYKATKVLDFCCGWGGRLIGSCVANIDSYTGIDINSNLKKPYDELKSFLKNKTKTEIQLIIKNALEIDYSLINYDMVFTSPPYYFLEKYSNCIDYKNKTDMENNFYKPLFEMTYKNLQKGGTYCLNINEEIYNNVCISVLGECHDKIELNKRKKNSYKEYIYIWKKLTEEVGH